jgi:hypothetical protein
MNILSHIALLAGLIASISLIWLVGRAFKKHAAWGIAVMLLSPVSAVIFAIKHWHDEKGPFLVYIASFITAVTLGLYVFTMQGGWDTVRTALRAQQKMYLQASSGQYKKFFVQTSLNKVKEASANTQGDNIAEPPPHEKSSTTQAGPAELPTITSDQSVTEKNNPASTSGVSPATPKHYRAAYVPIDPSEAGNYIGMTVKVKRLNRSEQDCVLRGISSDGLTFEQHGRGGIFSFRSKDRDIEKLRVLVKQEY